MKMTFPCRLNALSYQWLSCFLLLSVALMLPTASIAQNVKDQVQQDTLCYVFKLNNAQLNYIYSNQKLSDSAWLYENKVDSFRFDQFDAAKLPFGCYLKTHVSQHQVAVQLVVNYPFELSTKTIKEKHLLFLKDSKNKSDIQNATVFLNNRNCTYDSGFGAYVFNVLENEKAKENKYVHINYKNNDYYYDLQKKSNPQPNVNNSNGSKGALITPGYFILSQPKYRPLDTLQYKAYLVNHYNGKPLRKKVKLTLKDDQKVYWTKKIKAKTRGAYYDEFIIPDSLKIDKNYKLVLSYNKRGEPFYTEGPFKIEDYQLDKNKYEVIVPKDTFRAGEAVGLYAKATDANGFALSDTRLHLKLRIEKVFKTYQDTLIFRNHEDQDWYTLDTIMNELEATHFTIPKHKLINGLVKYRVDISMQDVRQEKKSFTHYFYWDAEPAQTFFTLQEDTIIAREFYLLQDTSKIFDLFIYQDNERLDSMRIRTPFKKQIAYNYTHALLKDPIKQDAKNITIRKSLLSLLELKTRRTHDSVSIVFSYPLKTPLHYKIYRADKEVASGMGNSINFSREDKTFSNYYLLISSNINGALATNQHYFKISQDEKLLQIEVEGLEKDIYPGNKVPLKIKVKDYKGVRQEKVNLTAYALSSMFGNAIQTPYIHTARAKALQLLQTNLPTPETEYHTNKLTLSQTFRLSPWMITRFNLHKNDFYKIHYAQQDVYTHFLKLESKPKAKNLLVEKKEVTQQVTKGTSELAILPILAHNMIKPTYVRVNGKLIYHTNTDANLPYSSALAPGMYTVQFRFQDYLLAIKNVEVKAHHKTLLCVRMDSILEQNKKQYILQDSLPTFSMTPQEFEEFDAQSLLIHALHFDTLKVYPLNNDENVRYYFGRQQLNSMPARDETFYAIGLPPHGAKDDQFVLDMGLQGQKVILNKNNQVVFLYENKIEYKTYDSSAAPLFAIRNNQISYNMLLQLANKIEAVDVKTYEKKTAALALIEKPRPNAQPLYYQSPVGSYQPSIRMVKNSVQLELAHTDSVRPVAVWFINKTIPNQSGYYLLNGRTTNRINHVGGAGTYDLYILYNNKHYQFYASQPMDSLEYWYVHTPHCTLKPLTEETLAQPIMLYNQLTQTPMTVFTSFPDENDLKVKIIKTEARNTALLNGILRNKYGQNLSTTEVYLEKGGRFYRGAITNDKGEFEFLNVAKGQYMLKVFAAQYLARYAYNIDIDQNAVYTYQIELSDKKTQMPDLLINENEVSLRIYQSAVNKNLKSYGRLYDMETRAPIAQASVRYENSNGKILARTLTNSTGAFELYEEQFVDSAYHVIFEHSAYTTLKLRNLALNSAYLNQMDVFLRTKSNLNTLPTVINLQLDYDKKVIKNEKPKETDYRTVENNEPHTGTLEGKIIDKNGQAIPFAVISAEWSGKYKGAAKSDVDGLYKIKNLSVGNYVIKISRLGYNSLEISNIEIRSGAAYTKNFTLGKAEHGKKLQSVMIMKDRKLNTSDNSMDALSTISGVNQRSSYTSSATIAGGRLDETQYMLDGMLVSSAGVSNLPPSALGGLVEFKSGLPAKFGEANAFLSEGKKQGFNFYDAAQAKSLRTRFSNLGFWEPNLVTNKDGIAELTVTFPDDVTQWRSFIVAMGSKYKNGVYSTSTKSYKPIMVNSIVPRFLYLSDALEAKAKFVNLDSNQHNVNIKISLNEQEQVNKNILLDRQYVDSTTLKATTLDSISWLAALDMDTYYKDGEQIKIPVYPDGLETKDYELQLFKEDSTHIISLGENTKTTVYFNHSVLENILVEIDKLKNYPYDCNEQKASKVKGLLVEERIRKQLKQPFENKAMLKKLINHLERSQKADGSWSWWTNGSSNHRMTLYIADVLQEANKAGYNHSGSVLAKEYIKKNLDAFNTSDKLYALYLLKQMNTYVKYDDYMNDIDFYNLNACDQLYYISNQYSYQNNISKTAVATCLSKISAQSNSRYADDFFFDPSANLALAIKLLEETPLKNNAIQSIAPLIRSGKFISQANTFSKVYLIEAWLKSMEQENKTVTAQLLINDSIIVNQFPYQYTTTDSQIKIKHSGAEVWGSMVRDLYLPDPMKRDSLFDVRTQFLVQDKKAAQLKTGEAVILEVKVMSFRTAKNVMLEVPIPSACTYNGKQTPQGNISHIEYYKHKALYYIENMNPGETVIKLPLRINFSGEFSVPPANVSLMYYPFQSGHNTKGRISIN